MFIDWFTVGAQIVNFLILVYLLKRFLYQPIVKHMNEREEKIASRLQEASDQRAKAQQQIDEFRRKQEEIEQQSAAKMEQAEEEAQKRRQELIEQARNQAADKRQSWLQSLDKEKADFARSLKKRTSQKILRFVQRTLQDLGDESLNNRLATVLLERMQDLDQDLRDRLSRAARQGEITVRSTFELEAGMKRKLTTALHKLCDKDAEVTYQVDQEQPLGIEVSAGSVRVSWSIAGYLDELEAQVLPLFDEKSRQYTDKSNKTETADEDTAAAENG